MAHHLPADLRVLLLEDGPLVDRVRATGRPVEVCDLGSALTPPPAFVVPPFLATDLFDTPPAADGDPDELRVLMLGRMAHWKGQLLGLRALAACRTTRRLRVTVAGGAWFGETGQADKVRRFA